jgi:hypothetical protein
MTRTALSIFALATTAFFSACGGGGGGGGGGSSGPTLDTPVSITSANYSKVASLAVRSNLLVADSPNFNNGYPAAVIGVAPPTSVNVMNLTRMQLVEIKKPIAASSPGFELPAGVIPDQGQQPCGATADFGTRTKTYTNAAGGVDEDLAPVIGDKLEIVYNNCKLNLTKEANNCVLVLESDRNITLNGKVTTVITAVNSPSVYTAKLTYEGLGVAGTRNSQSYSSTINGKLVIALSATSPQITLSTEGSDTLSTSDGVETDRLSNAVIQYDDNQQGCVPAAPNNDYVIRAGSRGKVANSNLGYVNASVATDLVGNSRTGDKGFPSSGSVLVQSDDGTRMTMSTLTPDGTVQLSINNSVVSCAQPPKWSDVFNDVLRAAPISCQ